MSNLHPVTIVDKNGRTTTVHRRGAGKPSTGTSLPSPKLGPQNGTEGTPLEPLKPATKSQLKALIQAFDDAEQYFPMEPEHLATEVSKQDQSLIIRLLDNPAIDSDIVKRCVQYEVWDESVPKPELANLLLVMEQMAANGDAPVLDRAGEYPLFQAILGADQHTNGYYLDHTKPITTQEELDAKTAFVTFALLAEQNSFEDGSIIRLAEKQATFKWRRDFLVIQNKHLRSLVTERPDKQHAITDYVRARGMHAVNKKPVDALRAYLDEELEAPAVNNGWL